MAKKKGKSFMDKIGVLAYVVGLVMAIAVTFMSPSGLTSSWAYTLAILGVIVGLLNIRDQEIVTFMHSGVAFIIAAWALMATMGNIEILRILMHAIIVFTAPGVLVVSFKVLFRVAKD